MVLPVSRARVLRGQQTSAEARLWQVLRGRSTGHYKFRRQHPIVHYIVDYVCLDAKLIIEIDGATHSTDAEIARDATRDTELSQPGFFTLRVTNDEVYNNLDGVAETILATIEQRHFL
jgi:very-short-patch-repair endonuclease